MPSASDSMDQEATWYEKGYKDALKDAVSISQIQWQVHQTAKEHGWWEVPPNFGEKLMLVVTEVAEAFEHVRNNQDIIEVFYGPGDKPDGVPIEFADVIIRILDLAEYYDMDIGRAIQIKMAYNETRPYKHGGKVC